MLPDRTGRIRVRANIDGEVEVRVAAGDIVAPRQLLAVIEGEEQLESLSVGRAAQVESVLVASGTQISRNTTVMTVRYLEE